MLKRAAAVVVSLALAGCGSKQSNGAECKAAAAEVSTYLTALEIDTVLQPQRMTLVRRDDLPHDPPATTLVVHATSSGFVFSGNPADNDLADRLQAAHAHNAARRNGGGPPADPHALFLEVDASVKWASVVKLVDTARQAGFVHPYFVFARTSPNKPPAPSKIDSEIAAAEADPAKRDEAIAELVKRIATRCPPLMRALDPVGPDRSAKSALANVGPALIECSCAADPASVRNVVGAFYATRWPVSFAKVDFAAGSPALAFAAEAPWSEVGPKLAATQSVGAFAVGP